MVKEVKFKVLMYLGQYIDDRLLNNGIYVTSKPNLYKVEATLDGLLQEYKTVSSLCDLYEVSEEFESNLRQCELVEVELKFD